MRKLPKTPPNDLMKSRIIDPLLENKPPGMDQQEWASQILGVSDRVISCYTAKARFTFSGYLCANDSVAVQCPEEMRLVKMNWRIWVVHDQTTPNLYRIETKRGVFQLTAYQWQAIQPHIKPLEDLEEV